MGITSSPKTAKMVFYTKDAQFVEFQNIYLCMQLMM